MTKLASVLIVALSVLALSVTVVRAQDAGLAQIKERELEAVREKISTLKSSMDKRASDRDRVTGELQSAEVGIVEKRLHLKDELYAILRD